MDSVTGFQLFRLKTTNKNVLPHVITPQDQESTFLR